MRTKEGQKGKIGPTVLVVDDQDPIRWTLRTAIERAGMHVEEACNGDQALQMTRTRSPDAVLLDLRMPGMDGHEVLRRAKALDSSLPIIIITAFGCVEDAVQMVKAGAFDYISKPFNNDKVIQVIYRALNQVSPRQKDLHAEICSEAYLSLKERMGNSLKIQLLSAEVTEVAPTHFSVLITGETGVGKEVVAQAIHAHSPRASNPFVPVDCGALPETLIESELFGHEKGAFTGADRIKPGKFEIASGGTLFLDEISNMLLALQSTLLRVLESKSFYRVGGSKPFKVDVRILAATNRDLTSSTSGTAFRSDLYYRLAEYVIHVPPLRERKEDIEFLVRRFIADTNDELDKNVQDITGPALDMLLAYDWPGNVRELRNRIRRAVLLANDIIEPQHLGSPKTSGTATLTRSLGIGTLSLKEMVHRTITDLEQMVFRQALEQAHGNKAATARLLKVDYKTVYTKLKEYGIQIRR